MVLSFLISFSLALFALMTLVLLVSGLIGALIPTTRRSALRLLRGGIFGALCCAALFILLSVLLGYRLGSVRAEAVLAAAALGFNICALIVLKLGLLKPVRISA